MKNANINSILILVSLLGGLGLMYFLSVSIIPKSLVTLTKASGYQTMSVKDSFFIGEKIIAVADGKDANIVNVFLVDSDGRGVGSKNVKVSGMDSMGVLSKNTDKTGRAAFEIKSETKGQYTLSASVDGAALPKKITVTFK